MKKQPTLQRWLTTAAVALALAASASFSRAQNTNPTNTFDTAASTASFVQWWGGGGAGATMTWDETMDAANDPTSGSVRYEVNFIGNAGEQFMTFFTIANRWGWDGGYTLDATTYTNLSFDLKIDPSSGQRVNANDYGWLEIGLVTFVTDWGQTYLPGRAIPLSATGWTRFDYPLNPTLSNIDKVVGFFIKMWSDGGHTNSLIFNVDNFMITQPTEPVVIPPPTMAITKAGPSGVQIIMDSDANQWQRDAISTPADGGPYLWTSQGSYPVSYSCTIADFPDAATHYGFEAHMYLVNGDTGGGSATSGSPDWNVPDLLIFRVENTAAGGALAQIQWKTNHPAANATNIPVAVEASSVLGTWTVTFTDATHGTLTGPGITATNFTLPEDAVLNNFSPATSYLQFGIFKNDGPNDGHNNGAHGTFSRVQFTGQLSPFDDDFTGSTLTEKYAWRRTSTTAVQYIPPGTAWVVDWTLPASGYSSQTAPAITGPWTETVFSSLFQSGSKIKGLISQADLPAGNAAFFRLVKREFVKLQVLMPGESPAPGTPTGKTGTPTAQSLGLPCVVTVRAVDAEWHLINTINHTVSITSSDGSASLPGSAALVGGVGEFEVYFGIPGTQTVTATDDTDSTKLPNTGSPTVVNNP
ncbi:MAG: hypothetical protein IH623_20675 [Verrucomicrobia bacterium]|nr:hypothetical protein [Verrucomicrobiota bacterium]